MKCGESAIPYDFLFVAEVIVTGERLVFLLHHIENHKLSFMGFKDGDRKRLIILSIEVLFEFKEYENFTHRRNRIYSTKIVARFIGKWT
jgi:hypothetical protein